MNQETRILIVDDEVAIRDSCSQALSDGRCSVDQAENGMRALEMVKERFYDLVLLDLRMPGLGGAEVLRRIRRNDPEAIVLIITGYATIESAVEAIKDGAYDYIPKPFTPDSLRAVVKRALLNRSLVKENVILRAELHGYHGGGAIVGKSKEMRLVEQLVLDAGPSESTLLISGESGTGKELIARAIHQHSPRRDKPFIAVDCGSLVANLFESELFGHVRGAFTDAVETKYGRFELASGGSLFFDEIGNISDNIQAKLLRVIQEQEITKVGSSQTVGVDVRLICATNKELRSEVKAGRFREDLYYRLNVIPIELPPLRLRRGDIPLLAKHFLKVFNRKRKKHIKGFSTYALKALGEYDWPGNVRELENAVERAVVLTKSEMIEPADLSYFGIEMSPLAKQGKVVSLDEMEKEHIHRALRSLGSRKGETAKALGIDRKTLRTKMTKYGLR